MALTSYFISAMSGNQDAFKEMSEMVQNGDITEHLLQEYFLINLIDGKFTFNTEKKNLYDLNEEMYQFAIKNFSEDFQIYKEKYIAFDLNEYRERVLRERALRGDFQKIYKEKYIDFDLER